MVSFDRWKIRERSRLDIPLFLKEIMLEGNLIIIINNRQIYEFQ